MSDEKPTSHRLLCERTITGVDFLRGAFSVMVVLAHATKHVREIRGSEVLTTSSRLIYASLEQGLVWVMGFFVISGFCIQHSTASSLRATGKVNVARYFWARITRIYPLYLIALALAIFALMFRAPSAFPIEKTAIALSMLQGLLGSLPTFENSWSLTNETFYYLVYGLLLGFTQGETRRILVSGTILSLALTAASLAVWMALGKPGYGVFPFWTIPLQMLVWLGGAGTFHYWDRLRKWFTPQRGLWFVLPLSFLIVYPFYVHMWLHGVRLVSLEMINLSWLPFFSLLLLALPHVSQFDQPRLRSWCSSLGLLSYPLFLLHSPIQDLLRTALRPTPWFSQFAASAQWAIFAVFPIIVCWLLARPLEARLLHWRRQWLKVSLLS